MAVVYKHTETVTLNPTQKSYFVDLVTSVWTGVAGDISSAKVIRDAAGDPTLIVMGTKVADTINDLPSFPIRVEDGAGDDYTYNHKNSAALTGDQLTKLATFLTDAWPGSNSDVEFIKFRRSSDGEGGFDIVAIMQGTMEAATEGDLPDPPYEIISIS